MSSAGMEKILLINHLRLEHESGLVVGISVMYISGEGAALPDPHNASERGEAERREKLQKVQTLMKVREHRTALFGPTLFGDPAWEVMLHLFAAHLEGSTVRTEDVLRAVTSVPTSTLLRFIRVLENDKRVSRSERNGNEELHLTLGSLAAMHAMFDIMPRAAAI